MVWLGGVGGLERMAQPRRSALDCGMQTIKPVAQCGGMYSRLVFLTESGGYRPSVSSTPSVLNAPGFWCIAWLQGKRSRRTPTGHRCPGTSIQTKL